MWPADVTVGSLLKGISGNDRCCSRRDPRFLSDVCFKEVRKAGLQPLLILIEVFIRHPDKSSSTMSGEEQREGQEVGTSFFACIRWVYCMVKIKTTRLAEVRVLEAGWLICKIVRFVEKLTGRLCFYRPKAVDKKTFPKFSVFVPSRSHPLLGDRCTWIRGLFVFFRKRCKASRLRWAVSSSRVILGLQCIDLREIVGSLSSYVMLFPWLLHYSYVCSFSRGSMLCYSMSIHSFIFNRSSLCCRLDLIHMLCE